MAKEIERKFLVSSDGWRSQSDGGTVFRQGYVVAMPDRSVRIRIMDGRLARLTIKLGSGSLIRDEFEYDIPIADAEELMPSAVGLVLDKTRYEVRHGGFLWEVDVYEGAYRGLVIAEVELESAADTPDLPDWLGVEVTGDSRYSNQSLATEPLMVGHELSPSSR